MLLGLRNHGDRPAPMGKERRVQSQHLLLLGHCTGHGSAPTVYTSSSGFSSGRVVVVGAAGAAAAAGCAAAASLAASTAAAVGAASGATSPFSTSSKCFTCTGRPFLDSN
jgi:hypothetical protein